VSGTMAKQTAQTTTSASAGGRGGSKPASQLACGERRNEETKWRTRKNVAILKENNVSILMVAWRNEWRGVIFANGGLV